MPDITGFNGPNRFLSNFWPGMIEFEGLEYPSVEHAYQAAKSTDNNVRESIRKIIFPGEAKKMGASVVLRPDWDDVKLSIMRTLLRKKFYNPELKSMLLATGDANLVEGNYWHDNFWGSCTCLGCGNVGMNHLGKLLMETRQNLVEATANAR